VLDENAARTRAVRTKGNDAVGPLDACLGSEAKTGFSNRADRLLRGLFARRAGVHVDFHAHRHFDDLWSLPGHSNLLGFWVRYHARPK
jgi:hypothetical protein